MAKRRVRICTQCTIEEETFSKMLVCASCVILNTKAANIIAEQNHLIELGYELISGPELNAHAHREYTLLSPCCKFKFTPTYGNVIKQVNSHGKPPCLSCGGKARMNKAMIGYVQKHGATYDLVKYNEYRKKVRTLSERTYKCWEHILNPLDLKRGRSIDFWHLDHKVPIIWCFKNDIEPEVAAGLQNLQMLPVVDNLQKSGKLLSDEQAQQILRESAFNFELSNTLGLDVREFVEIISDTANVWSSATKKLLIREYEYKTYPEAVLSRVKYKLNLIPNRLGARKLNVQGISKEVAKEFLERWHVQGWTASKILLGLFNGAELLSVMTFNVPRYKQLIAKYELVRFCTAGHVVISGAASKLFQHFIREHAEPIVSYSLNRWGSGDLYKKLGFELKGTNLTSQYLWREDGVIRSWRASILRARKYEIEHSGGEIEGALKIQDPGSCTWIYTPE